MRERNKKRYDSDNEYREYQKNKSRDHRNAVRILIKRFRAEFDVIYNKIRGERK